MGVDLGDLPKRPVEISDLSGKKFAVDAYNTIYQFLSSIRQPDGTPLMDFKGNQTGHLTGIFYRNCRLLENGIKPIYVFDGKPPSFKANVLSERSEKKKIAEAAWKAALEKGNLEEAKKHAQATSRMTSQMVEEAKELLSYMGIPIVQSPSEGEAQASNMVIEGTVDAVASQDIDCMLFGAPTLLRNLSLGGRRKLPGRNEYVEVTPEYIELETVLSTLGVTREQLIWIGMLVGTDFNEGVKGIGPKKALKLVKECNTLKEVVQKAGVENDLIVYEAVEAFFLNPPVEKNVKVEFGKMQKEKLVKFLCDKHDFSSERVERTCDSVEKNMRETGAQTRLGSWS